MYKLLRIALLAAPLGGGVAWAQASGTSGSAAAFPPPVTSDTRTPMQQRAGRLDDTQPALPGDATRPMDVPNTVPDSNRTGMPDTGTGLTTPGTSDETAPKPKSVPPRDESQIERRSDVDHDTSSLHNKLDSDTTRDQLDSDK